MRSKQEEIKSLEVQLEDVRRELGGFDVANLERERTKLVQSLDKLRSEVRLMALHGNSIHSWCDGSSDRSFMVDPLNYFFFQPVFSVPTTGVSKAVVGARCSSVVTVLARGAMGRRIDPSWWTH